MRKFFLFLFIFSQVAYSENTNQLEEDDLEVLESQEILFEDE